ncbi:hypothetical protein BGZ65_010647, partial [Modicella reniformis]
DKDPSPSISTLFSSTHTENPAPTSSPHEAIHTETPQGPPKSPADPDTNTPAKKAKKTASSSTRSIADDEVNKKKL